MFSGTGLVPGELVPVPEASTLLGVLGLMAPLAWRERRHWMRCRGEGVGFLVVGCWLLVLGCWFLVLGSWFLVLGSWFLVLGCWLLVVGCWLLVVGYWLLVVGCWLFQGSGFRKWGPGLGVDGKGDGTRHGCFQHPARVVSWG